MALPAALQQGEMEEELDKSMRAFGIDPASGRLSSAQYWAAREELQRRRARALAARTPAHRRRAGFLHSTIMWHIHRVTPCQAILRLTGHSTAIQHASFSCIGLAGDSVS